MKKGRVGAKAKVFFAPLAGGFTLRGASFRLKLTVRHTGAEFSDARTSRTGAGVVERARLESECAGNGTEGSNPSLSAISLKPNVSGRRGK